MAAKMMHELNCRKINFVIIYLFTFLKPSHVRRTCPEGLARLGYSLAASWLRLHHLDKLHDEPELHVAAWLYIPDKNEQPGYINTSLWTFSVN